MQDARALASVCRTLYAGHSWRWRVLQSLRPYICPFGDVMALVPPRARVLDVGSGSGVFLLLLASQGRIASGHGFDVSHDAIQAARDAARTTPAAASIVFEERAIEAGIPRGDWTVVSAVDVIHHVPPAAQRDFIRALCEAVPPGSRLIIKDMVARPRWRALANRMHDLVMARQWVHHVGPDEVERWVDGTGLQCVHRSRRNMFWYGHWTLAFDRVAGPSAAQA